MSRESNRQCCHAEVMRGGNRRGRRKGRNDNEGENKCKGIKANERQSVKCRLLTHALVPSAA